MYLCCKRYICSISLQWAVSAVSFHRRIPWKLRVLYLPNSTKNLGCDVPISGLAELQRKGITVLQDKTSIHFDTSRWTAIHVSRYTENVQEWGFFIKPVYLYLRNPIFTCKFIEVISNVISQVVVSGVLIVYELHITYVRHNSNIRVRIKWSHGPNRFVSFEVLGGNKKKNHIPILLVPSCVHSDIPG